MGDDQALVAEKRRTRNYIISTVILAAVSIGVIVALVVVKQNNNSNAAPSSAASMESVNVGQIPDVFHATVMSTRQSAYPSAAPYVAPMPDAHTHLMDWYQDRANGIKDIHFHIHKYRNESDEYRIMTDIPNRVQTVESYKAGTCIPLSIAGTNTIDTNFHAADVSPLGPVTVLGKSCQNYQATRSDGKQFKYSTDSSGNVCDIRVDRTVYTMVAFEANAARPAYSDACHAVFDQILAQKQMTHGVVHTQSVRPIEAQPVETLDWWNPWDDAKAAWSDVEHWAGDVYSWAQQHYCQLCEPIVDQVIDEGADIGSDFICDAATEGAAADFCGELAKDAVTQGCDLLSCAEHICSAIGRQSC